MTITDYANTSKFIDGCWTPKITGYDKEDNEYPMELDLYENAKDNFKDYKDKYSEHRCTNAREFYAEYKQAILETKYQTKHTV